MSLRNVVLLGCVCLILTPRAAESAEVPDLIAALRSPGESQRLQAIDQLAARGPQAAEAVGPLTALLKDGSLKVRTRAAYALGEVGPAAKPAAAGLVDLLKDPDVALRRQVVRSLQKIRPGPQVMGPLLLKLIEDSDPVVRNRVLHAIADAGPRAVPGLTRALKNPRATYWACLVLREIGPAAKDAVPALAETLQDPRPEVRREALLALAAMKEAAAPAAKQIAAALDDEAIRTAAAFALGSIGQVPAEAEAKLRAHAKSTDRMLGTASLWALARVRPEDKQLRRDATEQLIERVKDRDPFVRVAAARALASLPPAPEITAPLWEKAFQGADATTIEYMLDAVAQLGAPAVPRLIEALKHEKTRAQVIGILSRIGPDAAPATEALAKLVDDQDEQVAHEAVLALANIGPGAKAAVPTLVAALERGKNSNSPAIAYALGKIGPDARAAVPALTGLLKNPDHSLGLSGAWALAQIDPASEALAAKTVPVLIVGLSAPVPFARQGAAEALGRLGPLAKDAAAALRMAARDEDKGVSEAAVQALRAIAPGNK